VRSINFHEEFVGELTALRLLTLEDCTTEYVAWLNDPVVSQYLETRYATQTLASVRSFVQSMVESPDSYLFAIVAKEGRQHVGNLKVGPIQAQHSYADVSYFIGEKSVWGRGLASDAIRCSIHIGFERLGLHRLQAGLYERNLASGRALEKAGFTYEGRLRAQLLGPEGWEDHLWYGVLREEWHRQHETGEGKAI